MLNTKTERWLVWLRVRPSQRIEAMTWTLSFILRATGSHYTVLNKVIKIALAIIPLV